MKTKIIYKGIEFDVEFDYQPEEPMVRYYKDGSGYPGCPESINVYSISHKNTDFIEFLESDWEEIEELTLQAFKDELSD